MMGDIEKLDKQGLRKFGVVTGLIVVILFGLLLPLLFGFNYPVWPWYIAGVLVILAVVVPIALNPVYHTWMRFGLVLGWINTRIILGFIFFVVFTPVAFVLKLMRKDPMQRKLNADLQSYRVMSIRHESRDHMGRPF